MVTLEYFSRINPKRMLALVRMVHEEYPSVTYVEYLDQKPQTHYEYYLDNINFGGAYIRLGRYKNYDKMSKTFDMLPMFQIRVNPNKYMHEPFFRSLLQKLLSVSAGGYLRKYDYAIDIPKNPSDVKILDSKKEPGLIKGTRYYGQSGRHGYVKLYDKQKEQARYKEIINTPLTRVEHTLTCNKPLSLENVYILQNDVLKTDTSGLNDTDRAIVEMYLLLKTKGIDYELQIGRRKWDKIKEYISGQYALLDYGTILDSLLNNIKTEFDAHAIQSFVSDDSITDDECINQSIEDPVLLFE